MLDRDHKREAKKIYAYLISMATAMMLLCSDGEKSWWGLEGLKLRCCRGEKKIRTFLMYPSQDGFGRPWCTRVSPKPSLSPFRTRISASRKSDKLIAVFSLHPSRSIGQQASFSQGRDSCQAYFFRKRGYGVTRVARKDWLIVSQHPPRPPRSRSAIQTARVSVKACH